MSVIFKRLFHKRKSEPQPERGEAAAGTIDDKEDVTATLSIPTDEEELPSCGLHFPMADSGVTDLEKPGPAIEVAWDSRIGTRNSQQDSVEVWSSEEEMSVDSVLCDGMGGLAGGERASKLAATGMVNALRTGSGPLPQVMARAAAELNNRVKNLCDDQKDSGRDDPGCRCGERTKDVLVQHWGQPNLSLAESDASAAEPG